MALCALCGVCAMGQLFDKALDVVAFVVMYAAVVGHLFNVAAELPF